MHNLILAPGEDPPQSKDLRNTYPIQGLSDQQKDAPKIIMDLEAIKVPSLSTTDPNEPEESPPASPYSIPSTSPCGSAEWEQLSTTGTDQSTLSTEFEVLKGYNRIPIYERRAQWLAEQQARREQKLHSSPGGTSYDGPVFFRPNSQLPFPITAQFLRYYGGDIGEPWEQKRPLQSDDSQRTVVAPTNHFYTPAATASYLSTPTSSPSSPESAPEIPFSQRRELVEKKWSRPSPPSRKTSGIPSFTSLFESKWNWGWLFPCFIFLHESIIDN